jgi:type IV secretion system protein VirB10
VSEVPAEEGAEPNTVTGERGAASVGSARTLQSRVSNVLAMGLMGSLGLGLLGFYYAHTFARPGEAKRAAQTASRNQATAEMALPSLGKIDPPAAPIARILGPAPEAPPMVSDASPAATPAAMPASYGASPPQKPPWAVALERRLGGAVSEGPEVRKDAASAPVAVDVHAASPDDPGATSGDSALSALLHLSAVSAARARVLPAQRLLLPKGAFIDCTLETAIDSTLPGMTTCVTATDTFGVDGSTVLIERGSKLVGETRGEVHQGAARVFVLWTEARTPTGVIVPLSSPGTDELGRSGLPGEVNRHFFERFGAAILISVIDGAVQSAVSSRGGGAVIVNPSTSQDVMTEVLKGTINIPPTITKAQGDRIQVLVARDLDFRSVYELKSTKP